LRLKSSQYQSINGILLRKKYDSILLKCLEKLEANKVLSELHDGPAGGHFGGDTTAHKIFHVRYYWPTIFKDAHAYARKCKICQNSAGKEKKPRFPLQPVAIDEPFQEWGLDVIGEISLNSSKMHKYILTPNDYFTIWNEAIPLNVINQDQVISFIEQFIITKFGVPNTLIFNNASHFYSIKLI
jgi:hypothetical protein